MSTASNNQLNYQVRPFFQSKSICITERTGFYFIGKKKTETRQRTRYMKNINAKKVFMFDDNIMYAFNNLTPSHRLSLRQVRKGFN